MAKRKIYAVSFMKFLVALLTVLLVPAVHAQSLPPAQFGNLVYPAPGNIHLDEGTLDLWLIGDFDTDRDKATATGPDNRSAVFFMLMFPDENWKYSFFFVGWADALALVGYNDPGQRYIWVGPPHWKAGERRHVVMTWSGRKRSLYIDGVSDWVGSKGKRASRDVEVEGEFMGDLTRAFIQIGGGHSYLTVDEIHIRRIALTTAEVLAEKDAAPVADVNTLLLDHCDGGPPTISGSEGERQLTGTYEIVDGKFGKAIKLWKAKPE